VSFICGALDASHMFHVSTGFEREGSLIDEDKESVAEELALS